MEVLKFAKLYSFKVNLNSDKKPTGLDGIRKIAQTETYLGKNWLKSKGAGIYLASNQRNFQTSILISNWS